MNQSAAVFRLDEAQTDAVRRCLKQADPKLERSARDHFERSIENAIEQYLDLKSTLTFRDQHDRLRELFLLANKDRPPIAQLRRKVDLLPAAILKHLGEKADLVIPQLFRRSPERTRVEADKAHSEEQPDPPDLEQSHGWTPGGDFREWAKTASDERLVRAVFALVADGLQVAPGRKRPNGKQSRARIEPDIMGTVRGADIRTKRGGRPSKEAPHIIFIGSLVFAWEIATGKLPKPGRGDSTAFGDLVHRIFCWLGEPGAENALRRYWAAFAEEE